MKESGMINIGKLIKYCETHATRAQIISTKERKMVLSWRVSLFNDCFNIDEKTIDEYGAINISLINDLPLFIDPFLLFNSDDPEYQQIHREMIDYLHFLQGQAQLTPSLSSGMRKAWFNFSEVKQTWLGFSETGNSGRGMGDEFAEGLYSGLNTIFKDFAQSSITQSPHMEKLCLISPHVGRDKISDFATNFAKRCG